MTDDARIIKAAGELAIGDNGKPCTFTAKDVLRRCGYRFNVSETRPNGNEVRRILMKAGYQALGNNHYRIMTQP